MMNILMTWFYGGDRERQERLMKFLASVPVRTVDWTDMDQRLASLIISSYWHEKWTFPDGNGLIDTAGEIYDFLAKKEEEETSEIGESNDVRH